MTLTNALAVLAVAAACSGNPPAVTSTFPATPTVSPATTHPTTLTTTDLPVTTSTTPTTTTTTSARPAWIGNRPLPLLPDGTAQVLPTPPELVDRRFPTPDHLPPPSGDEFQSSIESVPAAVAARSTWREGCPLPLEELSYLTVTFFGFDGRFHTGEIIVEGAVAESVVEVFRQIHQARFPIEEMRVISTEDLEHPPTGDGNVTTGFVCRPVVFGTSWSEHAYGRAIDINPFHNPYWKGERVVPELASAYLDRDNLRPGMVVAGDQVTQAFGSIGWGWGGNWRTAKDWMHFSVTGR